MAKLINERTDRQQRSYSSLTSRVQEALSGIRVVKAYAQEDRQIESFERHADEYQERNMALARVSGLFHPMLGQSPVA